LARLNPYTITRVVLVLLLPVLIVIGGLVGSTVLTWRARSLVHYFATIAVFGFVLWSLVAWYQGLVLRDNQILWSPLILEGIAFVIFVAQFIWYDKKHNDAP
jgi:hypothetical protein